MQALAVATAQFEHQSGDKAANLAKIEALAEQAKAQGARVVAFHECSLTGYTFARHLDHQQMYDLAEPIPGGSSVARLTEIAHRLDMYLLVGLFERGRDDKLYKAYTCIGPQGVVANYRKLHPFINPHLTPGSDYVVFDIEGWRCGMLICYDNNVIENVRATALLGADIIFMPHVTMCTPSTRPGAGFVDPKLWYQRRQDPTSLRAEFDGLKGRQWLMKWLPARAYDNGVYVVFANPIGMDDDQLKNGCSMIIDPFGDVIAECRDLDDQVITATLVPSKLIDAGGHRYRQARHPDLYRDIIGQPHQPEQKVAWMPDESK